MGDVFSTLDLVIFFGTLIVVMAVGLIAGRREETSEDYFLAGRTIPWWGVAGSIFGSNVSANHMVGMMGIGFSIGFAQSHFELGAIFGLLVLCFGFLPVYRKLRVYTLSEYLGRRFDDRSRVAYAIIMVIIMAVVQMVPGLYIGARSVCVLVGGEAVYEETVEYQQTVGDLSAGAETDQPAKVGQTKQRSDTTWYAGFVIALAVVSAAYTIFGGLKAVVWTDMIQSVLLLGAGIVIAVLTFNRLGGWSEMMSLDAAAGDAAKMHLYLPSNHPQLPFTGVFTGLIAMHCFYWGTNQFIVQRALGARSDSEARLGIIAAGFLKLLIPFFAIGGGVAAFYVFQSEMPDKTIAPDVAFTELVKLVIKPVGYGVIGLISAGVIGAILSSIDSMMNSAATIVTFDIYKKYFKPDASDREMILVGRLSIVAFVVLAAVMAIFVLDPNSEKNFFLQIADYQNYLTPGLLVAFVMGMFWRRGTATAAIVTIAAGIIFSWGVEAGYNNLHGMNPAVYRVATDQMPRDAVKLNDLPESVRDKGLGEINQYIDAESQKLSTVNQLLGPTLNFFHRVVGVLALCVAIFVIVSLMTAGDAEKSRLVWTDLGGHRAGDLKRLLTAIGTSICVLAILGYIMYCGWLSPAFAAILGAGWTLTMFWGTLGRLLAKRFQAGDMTLANQPYRALLQEDRFWAGILCAMAVFMHFYFY
ncbi:MAG: sodium/solute symporter [Planctomycetaceae bacterium]|jgi:solute:Na+ symporter, SSS family|nr:sodium/solute symporter [Planctomycetaceae bacterium]MBT6153551.1 sodium/solute symporter [Planctomycetaceae bacterium]MBT6483068.1 sodium/solute symporter [Planctomycetaceae bacterium]MBT6495383.1 sodium/solute symporter [Planctomycetaceae bacterium]